MPQETQSSQPLSQNLPRLNLLSNQVDVLIAHIGDSLQKILSIRFTGSDEQRFNAMMESSFQQGRNQAFQDIMNYDELSEAGQ